MEFQGKFYIKKHTLFFVFIFFFLSLLSIQLALYGLVGYFCQKKRTFTNVIFCVQTSQL